MRKILIMIFLMISILFQTTNQCFSRAPRDITSSLNIKSSCYILGNRYSDVFSDRISYNGKKYKYLTELCTDTHRLVIFESNNIVYEKHFFDQILLYTLNRANKKITLYKDTCLSKVNVNRLQRCILEAAFEETYKEYIPDVVFKRKGKTIDLNVNGIEQVLNNLSKNYDNQYIYFILEEVKPFQHVAIAMYK